MKNSEIVLSIICCLLPYICILDFVLIDYVFIALDKRAWRNVKKKYRYKSVQRCITEPSAHFSA